MLTSGRIIELSMIHPYTEDFACAIEAEVLQAQEPAKAKFDRLMGDEKETPIERLRFFCSLAMAGQDWLDVEPLFDALAAPQPPAPLDESRYCPDCEALQAECANLRETNRELASKCDDLHSELVVKQGMLRIARNERDALQAKVAELSEELEEWRMTNKIDELYRELDAEKVKVAELREKMHDESAQSVRFMLHDHPKALAARDATIAQQAERIAELEAQNDELCRKYQEHAGAKYALQDIIKEQAALIEKCESYIALEQSSAARSDLLAALAAQKGGV